MKDAARAAEFRIVMTYPKGTSAFATSHKHSGHQKPSEVNTEGEMGATETVLRVEVPTFAARTRFLRRRLGVIEKRIKDMEIIKGECDRDAHRDAKRLAMGGFAMLVVYWAAVARLTFWDYGW